MDLVVVERGGFAEHPTDVELYDPSSRELTGEVGNDRIEMQPFRYRASPHTNRDYSKPHQSEPQRGVANDVLDEYADELTGFQVFGKGGPRDVVNRNGHSAVIDLTDRGTGRTDGQYL